MADGIVVPETIQERQANTLSYSVPTGTVSGALALVLAYFFHYPAEVAIGITVIAGFLFNQLYDLLRYYAEKRALKAAVAVIK